MTTIASIALARRLKWEHQQVHQTPKILNFPTMLPRRKVPRSRLKKASAAARGKLEVLFDQERSFTRDGVPAPPSQTGDSDGRRERVEVGESSYGGETVAGKAEEEEEKWKFQADLLRAECILLRKEREMAVMKMEQTKFQTKKALKSVFEILISGRLKIYEGLNAKVVIEEALADLAEKLKKSKKKNGAHDSNNLDKHSNRPKKKLQKFAEMAEIQETKANAPVNPSRRIDRSDGDELIVDLLRSKMTDLSISSGTLLEKMKEELGIRLSTACSSASGSNRFEFFDSSISDPKTQQDTMLTNDNRCSRRCKAIIRRIIEQVGAETEQWSQMQEMVSQVREEMEELRNARVFWENRATDSHFQIESLRSDVEEWRNVAMSSKSKEDDLQKQISILKEEIERLIFRNSPPRNDAKTEKVKRVIVCRSKENRRSFFTDGNSSSISEDELPASRRLPMRDIGNLGMTVRRDMKLIPRSKHKTYGN